MNNIICFSGYCLDLGKNHRIQIREWFKEYFKNDFLVIGHVCDSEHKSILKETFPNAIVQVEPNVPIRTYGMPPKQFKTGIQTYLQQIHSYRKVNALRKTILEPNDSDRIVRCRYDINFYTSPNQAGIVSNNEIGIPDFHHWGGYNDRMAIIGGAVADHYLDILTVILKNKSRCIHPEKNLKRVLSEAGVNIKMINIRFNRIRSKSLELNDCKIDQPWRV